MLELKKLIYYFHNKRYGKSIYSKNQLTKTENFSKKSKNSNKNEFSNIFSTHSMLI